MAAQDQPLFTNWLKHNIWELYPLITAGGVVRL